MTIAVITVANLWKKWQMLQAIMADQSISATAKNVAARLLDHLNNGTGRCSPSYETIARGIGLERRRAMVGVQELEKAGWITVERTTREKAKADGKALPSNNFAFDWTRCVEAGASAEDGASLVPDTSLASAENDTNPGAEYGTPLVPDTALTLVPNTAPKHSNINTVIEHGKKKGKARAPKPDPERNPDFITWLAAFPKKQDAKRAAEEFQRVVKGSEATPQDLIAGATTYAAAQEGQDPKYTKTPFTWLRDKRWRDEPMAHSTQRTNFHQRRLTAAEEMIQAGGWGSPE